MTDTLKRMKDGVFSASSRGKFADVPVEVVIEQGRIADIRVLDNRDTDDFSMYPSTKIPGIIKEYGSLDVDVVTGATFTSRAIINAVTDCIIQAEGDVEELRKVPGPEKNSKDIVNKECDICVLGTGGSGSCAAAAAAELGMKVIVLKKAGYNGGITAAANCMLAIDSKPQIEAGVHLETEEIFNFMMMWNHYKGNARLISKFLQKTASTVDWLIEKGIEINYLGKEQYTGPFDAAVHFKGFRNRNERRAQLKSILDTVISSGGEVLYETRGKSLIKDNGKVTGVRAVREDGTLVNVTARAVIVATGCFDNNKELAKRYFTESARFCMPKWLSEGDGFLMCTDAGADIKDAGGRILHLNKADKARWVESGFPGEERCSTIVQMASFPANVFLNYRGERYISEWLAHNSLGIANADASQGDCGDFLALFSKSHIDTLVEKGAPALGVTVVTAGLTCPYTNDGFFANMREELAAAVELGMCVKGETVEELAIALNIDPEIMTAEIDRYNCFCRKGIDEDYFKPAELLHAMEVGPYYALRCSTESMGSVGGIRIDDKMRVLDKKRKVITGLYCAGACAGGVWGNDSYGIIEGSTCAWAFNSGRMAGESAVDFVLQQ